MQPEDLETVPAVLTKYERARLIGTRVQLMQCDLAADGGRGGSSLFAQARREVGAGMAHASICRTANGRSEFLVGVTEAEAKPPSPPGTPPSMREAIAARRARAAERVRSAP